MASRCSKHGGGPGGRCRSSFSPPAITGAKRSWASMPAPTKIGLDADHRHHRMASQAVGEPWLSLSASGVLLPSLAPRRLGDLVGSGTACGATLFAICSRASLILKRAVYG